jgi:hypothetical protein
MLGRCISAPFLVLLLATAHCSGRTSDAPDSGALADHEGDGEDAQVQGPTSPDAGGGGQDTGADDATTPDGDGGGPDTGIDVPTSPDPDIGGRDTGIDGPTIADGGCRVPNVHVAQPFACTAATGYPTDAAPVSCTTDRDCSDGGSGGTPGSFAASLRCVHGQCSASNCMSNDDCANGGVCSCEGSTFGYGHSSFGNACVPSNCRSDGDCGPAGYCSPTLMGGPFYGTQGYYCHSCSDECTNDSDCGQGSCSYCAYDLTVGHWACSHSCAAG